MQNVKNRSVLMIYDQLYIGGIETLIIRTSKWLLDHGYEVKLVLHHKGDLFKSLDERVQVKVYDIWFELLFTPLLANIIFSSKFFSNIDIVYTFRPEGLWIASVLARVKNRKIKVFNCVYHPYEFYMMGQDHYQTKFYSKILLSSFPSKNLAFMNLPCRDSHESFFKTSFRNSFIFPLPVTSDSYVEVPRKPIKYKLVSIGNFKTFKTYNLYMIDIVEKLVQEGFPVQYEIFGDGEMRSVIEEKINNKNLNQYITLRGQVQYEKFKEVLKDAFLFIGMGTAAVEASLCKVPTIVATCDSSMTYGYMYNMPEFAVGEKIEGIKEFHVEDLIKRVFCQTNDEYESESLKNYDHALRYDMDVLMNGLIKKFENKGEIEDHSFEDLPLALYFSFYLNRILYKLLFTARKMGDKFYFEGFSKKIKSQFQGLLI